MVIPPTRDWRLHEGIDLKAELGQDVYCAMDGTVARVVRDERWGWRVEVEQTDGRRAGYCGLSVCDVAEGQNVTRGQALGALLERIPCEAELGAHLHLELTREGAKEDPLEMLPEKKGTAKAEI